MACRHFQLFWCLNVSYCVSSLAPNTYPPQHTHMHTHAAVSQSCCAAPLYTVCPVFSLDTSTFSWNFALYSSGSLKNHGTLLIFLLNLSQISTFLHCKCHYFPHKADTIILCLDCDGNRLLILPKSLPHPAAGMMSLNDQSHCAFHPCAQGVLRPQWHWYRLGDGATWGEPAVCSLGQLVQQNVSGSFRAPWIFPWRYPDAEQDD